MCILGSAFRAGLPNREVAIGEIYMGLFQRHHLIWSRSCETMMAISAKSMVPLPLAVRYRTSSSGDRTGIASESRSLGIFTSASSPFVKDYLSPSPARGPSKGLDGAATAAFETVVVNVVFTPPYLEIFELRRTDACQRAFRPFEVKLERSVKLAAHLHFLF